MINGQIRPKCQLLEQARGLQAAHRPLTPPSTQTTFSRISGVAACGCAGFWSWALFGDSHVTKALPLHHLWHSLLGTPGWVVAPPFWELGTMQGVLGRATKSPQSLPRANRLAKPDADRPSTETARRPASDRSAPPSTPASIKPKPHSCTVPETCLAHPWEGLQFPEVAPRARHLDKPDADLPG